MHLSHEAKVGMFFIISIALFGIMIEVGNRWSFLDKKVHYTTYLSSSTGLKQGDSVKLSGVDVGTITGISVADNKVKVDFEVKPETHIKSDSVAGIRMTNMLGGQFLGISFGNPTATDLAAGSSVKSIDSAGIDALMDNVGALTRDARQMIAELNRNQNEVMTRITAMLDENRDSVKQSLNGLASITSKIDHGNGSLAMLLNDKTLYTNTAALTDSLREVSGKLERGEGTIGKLLQEEDVYQEALGAVKGMNQSMKNFTEIAQRINKGEGTAGKLVNDPALYVEMKETVANLKEITRKINEGQGTVGKLVNDDKLYRDALSTLKKTEKAMEGLQDTGPISVIGSVIGTLF